MMIIDASALIAVLEREPERDRFAELIGHADPVFASVVSIQETAMVMFSRHGRAGLDDLWMLVDESEIRILPFDETQLRLAIDAFTCFGKGIHPTARLNMGDCASYALARTLNLPLLFKGEDFKATDISPAE